MELSRRIGFPTTLGEVSRFTEGHIERTVRAAKDPQLKMELENMPLPLSAEVVDAYLRPVLGAARTADPSLISNVAWGMARRGVHSYEGETGLWQGGPVRNSA